MTIKVLIIDDSALIRSVLTEIIDSQEDMQVVGVAADPLTGRELIRKTNPDVLTLDVEMPHMNGLEFLEKLMRLKPMPVLMVSSLTKQGSAITLKALELGAVDYVTKPELSIRTGMLAYTELLTNKIRTAHSAKLKSSQQFGAQRISSLPLIANRFSNNGKMIFIGASTGGTEAIRRFLMEMPADCPAILITQHMPEGFTASFAKRLDSLCQMTVLEVAGGEQVRPGHVYLARGDWHMTLRYEHGNYFIQTDQGPLVNHHRPSVEVLFHSAATLVGKNAVGIMLTGMGKDGATALLNMKQAGAYNFAQDEASCVVFGMPREAIEIGAVHKVVSITELAKAVLDHFSQSVHAI